MVLVLKLKHNVLKDVADGPEFLSLSVFQINLFND